MFTTGTELKRASHFIPFMSTLFSLSTFFINYEDQSKNKVLNFKHIVSLEIVSPLNIEKVALVRHEKIKYEKDLF